MWQMWQIHNRSLTNWMPQFSTNQMIGLQPKIEENWETSLNLTVSHWDRKTKLTVYITCSEAKWELFTFCSIRIKKSFMMFWTKNYRMRFYFLVSQWHLEDAVNLRRWKILFWRASYLSPMHRSVSHMTESSS